MGIDSHIINDTWKVEKFEAYRFWCCPYLLMALGVTYFGKDPENENINITSIVKLCRSKYIAYRNPIVKSLDSCLLSTSLNQN